MEEAVSTPPLKSRYRWVWRSCWIVLLLAFVWGVYLLLIGLPVLYSPPDKVRWSPDYLTKMNPPRQATPMSKILTNGPSAIKVTTNKNQVRIEYTMPQSHLADLVGFTLHRVNCSDIVRMGDLAFKLKRIGYGWAPPGTNTQASSTQVPANFYDPDFRLLTEAEVKQELPQSSERSISCQSSRPSYRFDMEISGGPSKFLWANLFDARTQVELTSGWGHDERGQTLHMLEMNPFLWRKTPVELVVDFATDVQEEILAFTNASFTIGAARYHLVFAGDGLSRRTISHGWDDTQASIEVSLAATNAPRGQLDDLCLLVFDSATRPSQSVFELEFLDTDGKKIETGAGNTYLSQEKHWLYCKKSEIKSIRVRKFTKAHRIVMSFPNLPGPSPANQVVENLFDVRLPLLRFDNEAEQEEYLERITQLSLYRFHTFSSPSLPSNSYPRWLTNATPVDVLEDFAQLQGVKGPFYVDQENLSIVEGSLPWLKQIKTKLDRLIEILKGP